MLIKVGNSNTRAWENYTLYDNGYFYAFFNVQHDNQRGYVLDIYRSQDGVNWDVYAKDILPLDTAHAGFGIHKYGNYFVYHPTCSSATEQVHFKTFVSNDLLHWEDKNITVTFDERYYISRWDELVVYEENNQYYGIIATIVKDEYSLPGCGFLKSKDGLHWDVLPPLLIDWQDMPSQHMEANFLEKIGGKYYLSMSGRLFMNDLGYNLFSFVSDKLEGPYIPTPRMCRMTGQSLCEFTWLAHTLHANGELLCTQWLSHDETLPSRSFAISTLKKVVSANDSIRLKYWYGNDISKKKALSANTFTMLHPAPCVQDERDFFKFLDGKLTVSASRDGLILCMENQFSAEKGFILSGNVKVRERRHENSAHQHSAFFGFYLDGDKNSGVAMVVDTHGITRTGYLTYADKKIAEYNFRKELFVARDLIEGRSGKLQGTLKFDCMDTTVPRIHANSSDLRHNTWHDFKFLAKGDFFELYVDDYYVQTFVIPENFNGKVGFLVCDANVEIENIQVWEM
jgi:hypothetical protein